MKKTGIILVCGVIGLLASPGHAADVAGPWPAEFESPRGVQKYLFTFQTDDGKLTGKAASEVGERKRSRPNALEKQSQPQIAAALFKGKTLVLFGPRQVGKTTLAQAVLDAHRDKSAYVSCELKQDVPRPQQTQTRQPGR
jgi:hypothetical protein